MHIFCSNMRCFLLTLDTIDSDDSFDSMAIIIICLLYNLYYVLLKKERDLKPNTVGITYVGIYFVFFLDILLKRHLIKSKIIFYSVRDIEKEKYGSCQFQNFNDIVGQQ